MSQEQICESLRQIAESVSAGLSDIEREEIGRSAAKLADSFRGVCGDEMVGAECAGAITRLMAVIQVTPLQYVGELLDEYINVYALTAGALAGVYELPGSDEAVNSQPDGDEEKVRDLYGAYL